MHLLLILLLLFIRVNWLRKSGLLFDLCLLLYYWPLVEHAIGLLTQHTYYLPSYFGSALLIFVLSAVITCGPIFGAYLRQFFKIRQLSKVTLSTIVVRHTAVAIYEEIIWRVVVLQVIANYTNSVFAVISASGLFFLLHLGRFFNTNQAVEFFVFSLLLSILYVISGSLLHVIVIHFVRNVLISINSLGKDYDEENTRTLNH